MAQTFKRMLLLRVPAFNVYLQMKYSYFNDELTRLDIDDTFYDSIFYLLIIILDVRNVIYLLQECYLAYDWLLPEPILHMIGC